MQLMNTPIKTAKNICYCECNRSPMIWVGKFQHHLTIANYTPLKNDRPP